MKVSHSVLVFAVVLWAQVLSIHDPLVVKDKLQHSLLLPVNILHISWFPYKAEQGVFSSTHPFPVVMQPFKNFLQSASVLAVPLS